jgi:hypothetical protein
MKRKSLSLQDEPNSDEKRDYDEETGNRHH